MMHTANNDLAAGKNLKPVSLGLRLWLALIATLTASLLIGVIWDGLGLPSRPQSGAMAEAAQPWGLETFVAWIVPWAAFISSLVLGSIVQLLPGGDQEHIKVLRSRALRADAYTYFFLPLLLGLCLLWSHLARPFPVLGFLFLTLVLCKAFIFWDLLWRSFLLPVVRPRQSLTRRAQLALFLTMWTLLGLTGTWVNQAVSSASDEVGYLLMTHSLVKDGTQEPGHAVELKAFQQFYWGRWSKGLIQTQKEARAWLFPPSLAPAYALGGRLGIMLLFAGLMALLAVQLLLWLESNGLRAGPAAAAMGLVITSAPVLFLSQQVYPDVPVMLLFVVGLRLCGGLETRPWASFLGLAGVTILMGGFKLRLVFLGVGLLIMAGMQLLARRLGWRRTLVILASFMVGLTLLFWLIPLSWLPTAFINAWGLALDQFKRAEYFLQPGVIFFRGLAVDQNYGVLFVAPVFLLALAGIPAAMRHKPLVTWQVLIPAMIYLAAMCLTRWFQWYAGFSVPGRFDAVILPGLALFLGISLTALSRPWLRLLVFLPAAWGLIYTILGVFYAQLRFSRAGLNPFVGKAQEYLGLELHHLFPSTFIKSPMLIPSLIMAGAVWMVLAAWVWRKAQDEPLAVWDYKRRDLWAWPVSLALLAGGLLTTAAIFPPRFAEAEHMRPQGATLWTEYAYPNFMRGMVLLNQKSITGRIYLPGGPVRIRIVGNAYADGELSLKMNERIWRAELRKYQRQVDIDLGQRPRGYQAIEISWSSCPTRSCPLLVDRLEVVQPPSAKISP